MTGDHSSGAEQRELIGDALPLSESFSPDGTIRVRIIAEGWGSSGYYSKKLLTEAAGLYKKNTRMFINHPTKQEMRERPERDLSQLAAYFVEDTAVWQDTGPYGPGLYQTAKPLPNYAEFLREAAPVIGVSHYVLGRSKPGEAAGRKGQIIESIDQVLSVDFVTQPGAKGSIGAIYESWKGQETQQMTAEPEFKTVLMETFNAMRDKATLTESQNQELLKENGEIKSKIAEYENEIKSLKEAIAKQETINVLAEAGAYVGELLQAAQLPDLAKDRLKESLVNHASIKEGKLDKDALKALAEAEIKKEAEYIASFAKSGQVRGMGQTASGDVTLEEAHKALIESYVSSGISKEIAENIVRGL